MVFGKTVDLGVLMMTEGLVFKLVEVFLKEKKYFGPVLIAIQDKR